MKKIFSFLILFYSSLVFSQTATLSGTAADSNGQAFIGGTYTIQFVPTPGNPGPYTQNGVPFTKQFAGNLNGSGAFSQVLARTDMIQPAFSKWAVSVCPNIDASCYTFITSVTGNLDISAQLTIVIGSLSSSVFATSIKRGYTDSNITLTPNAGAMYYSPLSQNLRLFDGAVWHTINSSIPKCSDQLGSTPDVQISNAIQKLPSTGGMIDCTGFSGTITGSGAPTLVDRPVQAVFSCVQYNNAAFTVTRDLSVIGMDRNCTIFTPTFLSTVFDGTASGSSVKYFNVQDVGFTSNGSNSSILLVPSFSAGVNDWSAGRIQFKGVKISNFTSGVAIGLGQSVYFNILDDVIALGNDGIFQALWASNVVIKNSIFATYSLTGSHPQLRISAGDYFDIHDNNFERDQGGATGGYQQADIEINSCTDGGTHGFGWIHNNRFGPEGESYTRYKIANYCSTNVNAASEFVTIDSNIFGCNPKDGGGVNQVEKVIGLINPINHWRIGRNSYNNCTTFVDDIQPIGSQLFNILDDQINNYVGGNNPTLPFIPIIRCTNGCTGFNKTKRQDTEPFLGSEETLKQGYVNNRVKGDTESPLATGWSFTNTSVSATGVVDPYGSNRAVTLTKTANASANGRILVASSSTNLDSTHLFVRVWVQDVNCGSASISLFDNTAANLVTLINPKLSSYWFPYDIDAFGMNSAHTFQIIIYPGTFVGTGACSINLFAVQASDWKSWYLPNTTAASQNMHLGAELHTEGIAEFGAGVKIGRDTSGLLGSLASTISNEQKYSQSLTFGTVAANDCVEQNITATGVIAGDAVSGASPTASPGAKLQAFYYTGAGIITVRLCNPTVAGVASTNVTWNVWVRKGN